MTGRRRAKEKAIAKERIVLLLRLADEVYKEDPDLALKYGELARRISERTRVKIPREWKWRFCKRCGSLLFPGKNAVVRVRDRRMPHLVIHCLRCGGIRRIPYLREKKFRRKLGNQTF